jgi:hypothetical protein
VFYESFRPAAQRSSKRSVRTPARFDDPEVHYGCEIPSLLEQDFDPSETNPAPRIGPRYCASISLTVR